MLHADHLLSGVLHNSQSADIAASSRPAVAISTTRWEAEASSCALRLFPLRAPPSTSVTVFFGPDRIRQETWPSDGKGATSFLAGDVKLVDCLRLLIDPPIEVESSCCESLVGLLTRASSSRSCLPRVSTPVAFFAPALRAYSGVGHAGFAPASQINQTRRFIAQRMVWSQAKLSERGLKVYTQSYSGVPKWKSDGALVDPEQTHTDPEGGVGRRMPCVRKSHVLRPETSSRYR
jgi:hypothetical protein